MDIEEQYDKIYRYCYFKLYDKQLAQDITQETFLRFYRQGLRLDRNKVLPYLYTIAKNLCVDSFRKKNVESLEDVTEEITYDPTEDWISNIALRGVISKLPQDEQELIFLRYVNEIGIAAICRITGFSRFAVSRRLTKALKGLKDELKKEGFSV
ncbi:MAG: RNA polymerase sigma factor [Lachnospiraceae bacterium]|jgi:RNA polymerase sigma-70 factor (ECF subfamily)|nr:RNA polymerase sigma factor [Lachnospiraceae bacterium]